MGRERYWKGQYLHICSACLIFLLFLGCAAFEGSRNMHEAEGHLLRGQQLLARGDYRGAREENQKVLSVVGKDRPADEALFYMGLIYAHYGNPEKDYNRSVNYFEKVIDEYPQSPFLEQAKIWTGVLKDMEKLKRDELVITNEHILRSRQMLAQGNYREALKEIQNILPEPSGNPYADRALFYAGLIYAHYGNPEKDYKKSVAYFEQLIKEYPQSYLLEQAKIMIGILNVIEKAKQVDIEIEKKRQEMTR